MYQHKVYVSEKVLTRIFQIIERLQKASPYEAVTKNRVRDVIENPTSTKPKLDYRTVGRAFRKLCDGDKIKQDGRSQYWLPEYLDKKLEYQKKLADLAGKEIAHMSNFMEKDVVDLITKLSVQETWLRRKFKALLEGDGEEKKWRLEEMFSGELLKEWRNIIKTVKKRMHEKTKREKQKKLPKKNEDSKSSDDLHDV